MLKYLMYSSVSNITDYSDLDTILKQAVNHNLAHNITGILLFDDQHFLQILEGEESELNKLIKTIQQDPRHHEVLIKIAGNLEHRNFEDWSMRLSFAAKGAITPIHEIENNTPDERPEQKEARLLNIMTKLLGNAFTEYKIADSSRAGINWLNHLTDREREVLKLLLKGNSAKEIGSILDISAKTASNHVDNIRTKLHCPNYKALIKKVFESGHIMYFI